MGFIDLGSGEVWAYLFHAESPLVHVAQVEHGLRVALLVRRQAVMHRGRLVVDFSPVAIVMIVANFDTCSCVA